MAKSQVYLAEWHSDVRADLKMATWCPQSWGGNETLAARIVRERPGRASWSTHFFLASLLPDGFDITTLKV